ncbi:MAG TPA: hypothetical protein VFR55_08340, partial [Dehalococcoidia bacterium]|nr:hypothetical protein [Dehalococcoidia bacterium]
CATRKVNITEQEPPNLPWNNTQGNNTQVNKTKEKEEGKMEKKKTQTPVTRTTADPEEPPESGFSSSLFIPNWSDHPELTAEQITYLENEYRRHGASAWGKLQRELWLARTGGGPAAAAAPPVVQSTPATPCPGA